MCCEVWSLNEDNVAKEGQCLTFERDWNWVWKETDGDKDTKWKEE